MPAFSKEFFDIQATKECGFTLKRVRDMTRAYTQMQRTDKYSEHNSIIWPLCPNGSVFVLRTKWFWVRVQLQSLKFHISRLPWHSGNYRVWIHSETRTWHDKNIRSPGEMLTILLKNDCGCEPRFLLYMFPSIKRNFKKREAWMKRLKRVTADNKEWILVVMTGFLMSIL